MNKKIEELAKESYLHHYMVHLYTVYAPDGYRVPLENRMISVEKFAELILMDAMKIVHDEVVYEMDEKTADRIVLQVGKYFGVEE